MRRGWLHPAAALEPLVWATRTESSWERARGLLGRPLPVAGTGLIISPCGSVHTLGMRYAIDVVFLSKYWQVLHIAPAVKPWRMTAWRRDAAHVLELAPGEATRIGLAPGMELRWAEAERPS